MDHYSIVDHEQNPMPASSEFGPEPDVPQVAASRSPQASVSAGMAAVNAMSGAARGATPALRSQGQGGGHTLAEMAQRDLDAALQLLAERAQYITEASGAVIALRRNDQNDMLCRASAGSNVPELGTLLSTEFGLSGECVRTRLPLRCDNADRDPRVNREGCRQLGIASVAVLPIVGDDQILGVFELFSGKTNAFEERDLSALQRLGEMVETAIRLAQAAQNLPPQVLSEEEKKPVVEVSAEIVSAPVGGEAALAEVSSEAVADSPPPSPKKPLFWSAALHSDSAVSQQPAGDQSHVPPVLRALHKCQACGFPVSQGRTLCVECEERQWRGQLRVPPAAAPTRPAAPPASDMPGTVPAGGPKIEISASAFHSPARPGAAAAGGPTPYPQRPGEVPRIVSPVLSSVQDGAPSAAISPSPEPAPPRANSSDPETRSEISGNSAKLLFLNAGESWFSAHKYILGSLVVVAVAIALIALVR